MNSQQPAPPKEVYAGNQVNPCHHSLDAKLATYASVRAKSKKPGP